MTDIDTKIALLENNQKNHEDVCTERYTRISNDTTEIKTVLSEIRKDIKDSVERIHIRIDEEADARRAGDGDNKDSINNNRNWALGSVASATAAAALYFVVNFFKGPN